MTSVAQSPTPILQFLSNAGLMNVGGSLLTQVGSVNYPTWQDPAGATALPNPIPLNSRGEISNTSGVSVPLYLAQGVTYEFTLFDAHGNQIWVDPNVVAQGAAATGQMTDEGPFTAGPTFTGSITGTALAVSGVTGTIAIGQTIYGSGVTAGTTIISGAGAAWVVSTPQTVGSEAMGAASATQFVPGFSTSLTLTGFYGSKSNLWVEFDAASQSPDTLSLNGFILGFNAPIPVGVLEVNVKGGTTATVGTPGAGTVTDASVATNAGINASKLAFLQKGVAATTRTVLSKLQDVVSLYDFGCVGDGVTDDTAKIQAAANYAMLTGKALYAPAPSVSYMTTAPISVTAGFKLFGDGVMPYTAMSSTGANTMGLGSWFYFNHTGRGFDIEGGTAPVTLSGMTFDHIGTYRKQPTPNGAATYTPTVCDYDFYINNADVFLDHVCTLNPYAAVYLTAGNQGRLTVDNLVGQPLAFGIYIDTSFDSCRIKNVHLWPYWSEALGVNTYTLTSGQAFVSARSDTAMYSNCFSYGYNKALNILGNVSGTTTAQFSNFNIDDCFDGVIVDPTANGARLNFANLSIQGASTNISAISGGLNAGISVFGTNCNVNFKGVDAGFFGTNVVNVGGSGNVVLFSQARFYTWNVAAGAYTALLAQAGSTVIFDFKPEGGGATALFGGPGTIKAPLDWGQTTGTTDTQGRLTINHNGGMTPNVISSQVWNDSAVFDSQVSSAGASAFTLRFFTTSTGAPLVSTNVTVSWDLKY